MRDFRDAKAMAQTLREALKANVDYSGLPLRLQARFHLPDIRDPSLLADTVAPLLPVAIEQRQRLLETSDLVARLVAIFDLIRAAQQAA